MADAAAMVDRCFRRQHPELWGGTEVPEPSIPVGVRYSLATQGEPTSSGATLAEEYMGNGEVLT